MTHKHVYFLDTSSLIVADNNSQFCNAGDLTTIPMNRLGSAEECAGAFVYLASEQMSGYVTGQIIEVNGGQYMP